jgi:hypothetical protein
MAAFSKVSQRQPLQAWPDPSLKPTCNIRSRATYLER